MKPSTRTSRFGVLAGPLLLLAIAIAFLLVLFAQNGPVRVVTVSGDLTPSERAEVRDAVMAGLERRYFDVDLDRIVARVAALSWPHEVSVRRIFPDGVGVEVRKEVFVARWGGGGVLNSEGRVIATTAEETAALPLLDCARADGARAMQMYRTVVGVLSGRGLRVSALRENAIGEWRVDIAGDIAVMLGNDDTMGRLERFVAVWDDVLAKDAARVASVDARYPNGIAVSWRTPRRDARGSIQLAALDRALAVSE